MFGRRPIDPDAGLAEKRKEQWKLFFFLLIMALVLLAANVLIRVKWSDKQVVADADEDEAPTPATFTGSSNELNQTAIVPTLESPLPEGKSAVWCATLALAWQELERQREKKPLELEENNDIALALSRTPDPELARQHYYDARGLFQDGIVERIRKELAVRFPRAPLPKLNELPEGAMAYAYLEAGVRYTFAFNNSDQPLQFKDSRGRPAAVRAFGIRADDKELGVGSYRSQVRVLFRQGREFAVDLCSKSEPYQIVLARVQKQATL